MNLVASEFAASRVDGDGVLAVSEFAGIAERSPGAILVNPYDLEGCAGAIATGLAMDPDERRSRMSTLRERVRSNPASRWADRCLGRGESRSRFDASSVDLDRSSIATIETESAEH
jgi:trehalose-6-phosphate synthase